MYPHPSVNADVARQRRDTLLREAHAERMVPKAEEPATPDTTWLGHVAHMLQLHLLGHVKRPTFGTR